jgi:hypothetical protein
MSTHQSVDGLDVELTITPRTPRAAQRVLPSFLEQLDRLAFEAARLDPDWHLEVSLGPGDAPLSITAEPAITEDAAA